MGICFMGLNLTWFKNRHLWPVEAGSHVLSLLKHCVLWHFSMVFEGQTEREKQGTLPWFTLQTRPGWSSWLGSASRSSRGLQGPDCLSQHLLPLRVFVSRSWVLNPHIAVRNVGVWNSALATWPAPPLNCCNSCWAEVCKDFTILKGCSAGREQPRS